jgi:hypothetical protein
MLDGTPPQAEVWCDSCGYSFRIGREVPPDTVQCPMCGEPVIVGGT